MNRIRKLFGTAVFWAIVSWGWIAPQLAPAQLLPPPPLPTGSLIVTITSPASGSTVSGTIPVNASVSIVGSLTVANVEFFVDGNFIGNDSTPPYSVSWNTRTVANGPHNLTAVARDALGIRWTSNAVSVTVSNVSPPTITGFSPTSGPAGTSVTISGTNFGGATAVRFNEVNAGFTVSSATAIQATVPAGATTGPISVTTPGGTASSSSNFTVIPPPTITGFSPTSGPAGTIVDITGSHFSGASAVRFNGVSASFTVASATLIRATVPSGATTGPISVTTPGGTATSSSNFTVLTDTTPPTVAITSPTDGATVSGTITVTADASDNVGVVGVQFKANGANLGAEDITAPYSVTVDTTKVADGSYMLTAVARDAAGNTTTSAPVTVTVSNAADTTPPSVTITNPADETTVSGTIMVSADATDNVAVAGVLFQVNGVAIGAEDTAAPYSIGWDTTTVADGTHTLTAVARDTAGNSTTSAGVTVTVSNEGPTATRFEETAATFAGEGWMLRGPETATFSGGNAATSNVAGDASTFTFTGTAVSWIGLRCNVCGIATVSVDGGPASTVDTAGAAAPGSPGLASDVVFTASGLSAGTHTLTITVTGTTSSGDTHIAIDAFDVIGSGPTATRIEDTDPAVTYTPESSWVFLTDSRATNGTAAESQVAGAVATLTFTGTEVRWLGYHFSGGGIARVYVNGTFVGEVDQYSPSEVLQAESFAATGLARGTHTLTIEVTGTKRPESSNTWVLIDAFDVMP